MAYITNFDLLLNNASNTFERPSYYASHELIEGLRAFQRCLHGGTNVHLLFYRDTVLMCRK